MKENNQPLVSIIIPSYNRADLIGETLESIISQTYKYWECIIVDDGSTDNSIEVIQGYVQRDIRIKFYSRPETKPKGANACRNYGLEQSSGVYINWLDSDDLFHPQKLEKQIQQIIDDDANYSICRSYIFEDTIKDVDKLKLKSNTIKSNDPFNDFISKHIVIPIQAPVLKKCFLIEHGYFFDEALQAGQEWELFARILHKHPNYSAISEPLDYIRVHPNNISNAKSEDKYWHYYEARVRLEEKSAGKLSRKSKDILNIFYLFIFKRFVRTKQFKNASKVFNQKIKFISKLSVIEKMYLRLGLLSYKCFGKGDFFLSKVTLYK